MIPVVLSVDDDNVTQMLNRLIFTRSGFSEKTVTCTNGKEALLFFDKLKNNENAAADQQVGLVFLDLNMPVMDGWEFLEKFTQHYLEHFSKIKVVILSSTINPEEKDKVVGNESVIEFLSKPLTLQMMASLKQHPALKQYFPS